MAKGIDQGIVVTMFRPLRWVVMRSTSAIALWPFIFVRASVSRTSTLLHHERIHLRQQLELLLVFFYVIYLTEYVYFRLRGLDHSKAYRSISFEREAYSMQEDQNYLRERPFFAMWR